MTITGHRLGGKVKEPPAFCLELEERNKQKENGLFDRFSKISEDTRCMLNFVYFRRKQILIILSDLITS